jgi:hypothetical protein
MSSRRRRVRPQVRPRPRLTRPAALNGSPHAEETYAAVLINAEFLLVSLNAVIDEEDRRYNPFLRHWASVVMRCQPAVLRAAGGASDPNPSDGEAPAVPEWWATAHAARLKLIKCAFGILVTFLGPVNPAEFY